MALSVAMALAMAKDMAMAMTIAMALALALSLAMAMASVLAVISALAMALAMALALAVALAIVMALVLTWAIALAKAWPRPLPGLGERHCLGLGYCHWHGHCLGPWALRQWTLGPLGLFLVPKPQAKKGSHVKKDKTTNTKNIIIKNKK